jgi:hypothetical protein
MRYANRFGCIGPACEDTCCGGWRIDVDRAHYERLLATATFSSRPLATRMKAAIRIIPPKNKREKERYQIKLNDKGFCSMLDPQGFCEVHQNFGISALWDVCAFYPRKLKYVGPTLELSLTASCPEVARELLIKPNGTDFEPIDTSRLERRIIQDGLDPRDLRPFFRAYLSLREFMLELWSDLSMTQQQKYFLTAWFAKRTSEVLKKHGPKGDLALVDREMSLIRRSEVRHEILKRFEAVESPAGLILWLVRAIVRPWSKGGNRSQWSDLAQIVVSSYRRIETIVPSVDKDEAAHDAAESRTDAESQMTGLEVWNEYLRRRERLRLVPELKTRFEEYFERYMKHTWFHKMPSEAEDILHYVLRVFVQHAAIRFIIISHPLTQEALDRWYGRPDEPDTREADAKALCDAVDKVAVMAFQKMARHVEHGELIKAFNRMLKSNQLFSMAGAVYLLRF